jgi:hypothetical protein
MSPSPQQKDKDEISSMLQQKSKAPQTKEAVKKQPETKVVEAV